MRDGQLQGDSLHFPKKPNPAITPAGSLLQALAIFSNSPGTIPVTDCSVGSEVPETACSMTWERNCPRSDSPRLASERGETVTTVIEGMVTIQTRRVVLPDPVFLDTEGGTHHLSVVRFEGTASSEAITSAIAALAAGGHEFKKVSLSGNNRCGPR